MTEERYDEEFCRNWSNHSGDIAILRFLKMAAPAIMNFRNREILLADGVHRDETQRAKFRQNRSIGCEDIKIFRFFNIAAVRHLGFVWGTFEPPTENS